MKTIIKKLGINSIIFTYDIISSYQSAITLNNNGTIISNTVLANEIIDIGD